jgi:hypothetical protein
MRILEIVLTAVLLPAWAAGGVQAQGTAAPLAKAVEPALPFEPVLVAGRTWTFHTSGPPKEKRRVLATHPRLLVTRQTLPALREKLKAPVYESYMAELLSTAEQGDACANALLYHLHEPGQREAFGRKARQQVLAGAWPQWGGLADATLLAAALAYDWTADLLTPDEKTQVFERVRSLPGVRAKPQGEHTWYENDCYARGGTPYRPLVALAAHGDGVDDAWCAAILDRAYGEDLEFRGPYGPLSGRGYLDVLNSIALDTGGSQAGNHGTSPTTGYTSMYLTGSPLVLAAWETATGERLFERCNYFRYLPYWLAYESDRWVFQGETDKDTLAYVPSGVGLAVLEYITGAYRDIEPNMAALAAWHLKEFGPDKYTLIPRLILGDLRVEPKSPEVLGLPTAAYLRGADCFFSMSSWEPDASRIRFQIRCLDTNRYEPHTNVFSISKYGFVAPGGRVGKGTRNPGNHSGLWFYEPGAETEMPNQQQGSTYWSGLRYPAERAQGALEVATEPCYRAGGPRAVGVHEGYRFATADAARLLAVSNASRYERTILHLLPLGPNREYVVVHDRTEASENVRRAWNLRTLDEPATNGRVTKREAGWVVYDGTTEATVTNRMANCHGAMHLTVVLPENPLVQWRGGLNFEGMSPEGDRYVLPTGRGDCKQGYAESDYCRYKYGAGNLFIQAPAFRPRQNYLMVMQLADADSFDPAGRSAVARLHDAEIDAAQLDEWVVVFTAEPTRRNAVTYTLAAEGAARHVVLDLEPGVYQVCRGPMPVAEGLVVQDRDFSLGFHAPGAKGDIFTVARKE